MTAPLIVPMPGNETLARNLCALGAGEFRELDTRAFPDGETYLRFPQAPSGRSVALIATLADPNEKFLPLLFAARTARELGARRVGLVAPYLSYMRQDARFHPGEAVTSRHFASLISADFDWLVTVDPHLHRYRALGEIYTIPARSLHAAPLLAAWIEAHAAKPFLIGPDVESEQWVSQVAKDANAPYIVLEKVRKGDTEVNVTVPQVEKYKDHTPVLVDDIISTARTMIETVNHLKKAGMKPPVCIGVHAVFAGHAYQELQNAGVDSIITCNTIAHASNALDVTALMAASVNKIFLS